MMVPRYQNHPFGSIEKLNKSCQYRSLPSYQHFSMNESHNVNFLKIPVSEVINRANFPHIMGAQAIQPGLFL
jgi:hypothetical protein